MQRKLKHCGVLSGNLIPFSAKKNDHNVTVLNIASKTVQPKDQMEELVIRLQEFRLR